MPDTPVPRSLVMKECVVEFDMNPEGGMYVVTRRGRMTHSFDYLSPAEVSQLRCWLVDLKEEEMRQGGNHAVL